ncbi:MAG: hypothetical protein ACPGYV_14130 [Phycisphaeraceae bacterium]
MPDRVQRDTDLRYVVIRPVSPNQYDRDTRRIDHDPTIIPYSGWHFFGPDGTPQPWRKRLLALTPHYSATGGLAESTRALPQVDLVWTHPIDSPFWIDAIEPSKAMAWQPDGESHSGGGQGSKAKFGQYSFETKSIQRVPETLDLALTYLNGEQEKVAEADLNTALPVGDENMTIAYLGKPRAQSPAVMQAIEDEWLEDNPEDLPYTLELQTTQHNEHPKWKYTFRWDYEGQDGAGGAEYTFGKDSYELWTIKPRNFTKAWIERMPQRRVELDPIDLSWLQTIDPKSLTQRRVQIDDSDRFTEPRPIEQALSSSAVHAYCMLDLDTLAVYRMPDPMPESESLAKLYEELGVDLMIYEDDGRTMRIHMLGCSAFILNKQSWDKTPLACLTRASHGNWQTHQTYFEAWRGRGSVLVTTAEGGTVLFRVAETINAKEDQPGTVRFEVRELEPRALSQLSDQ